MDSESSLHVEVGRRWGWWRDVWRACSRWYPWGECLCSRRAAYRQSKYTTPMKAILSKVDPIWLNKGDGWRSIDISLELETLFGWSAFKKCYLWSQDAFSKCCWQKGYLFVLRRKKMMEQQLLWHFDIMHHFTSDGLKPETSSSDDWHFFRLKQK